MFHAQVRASMCFSLSNMLSIWSKGKRPFMGQQSQDSSHYLGKLFFACYTWLAGEALQNRELLWKLRPKHHYFVHLVDHAVQTGLNPMHMSNFLDEDMMKAMRGVAKACHAKSVKVSWARRYVLKKVLSWKRSSHASGKKKCMPIAANAVVQLACMCNQWIDHVCGQLHAREDSNNAVLHALGTVADCMHACLQLHVHELKLLIPCQVVPVQF